VFDSPLAEGGIAAIAMGMGLNGLRLLLKFSLQTTSSLPMTKSSTRLPNSDTALVANSPHHVTFRTPAGGGIKGGHHHSQSPEAQFTHTPGLKVVYCSNPYNAKGLLTAPSNATTLSSSLNQSGATVARFMATRTMCQRGTTTLTAKFLKGTTSYRSKKLALSKKVNACTVIAWGTMVHVAEQASRILALIVN